MLIVYGYVIDTMYTGDGTLMLQVRIPQIHGAIDKNEYRGKKITKYTEDKDLPWYQSLLLPYLPNRGSICMLASMNDGSNSSFVVLGLTGGSNNKFDLIK